MYRGEIIIFDPRVSEKDFYNQLIQLKPNQACSTGSAFEAFFNRVEREMAQGKKFDIIFMDPPYGQGVEKQVLSILSKTSAADDETLIILETDAKEDMSYVFSLGFEVIKVKQYKNNKHVFLRKSN